MVALHRLNDHLHVEDVIVIHHEIFHSAAFYQNLLLLLSFPYYDYQLTIKKNKIIYRTLTYSSVAQKNSLLATHHLHHQRMSHH